MILANATVEKLRDGSVPLWEVTVWGIEHDHQRKYQLERKSDTEAALDGIAMFEDEVTDLLEAQA